MFESRPMEKAQIRLIESGFGGGGGCRNRRFLKLALLQVSELLLLLLQASLMRLREPKPTPDSEDLLKAQPCRCALHSYFLSTALPPSKNHCLLAQKCEDIFATSTFFMCHSWKTLQERFLSELFQKNLLGGIVITLQRC